MANTANDWQEAPSEAQTPFQRWLASTASARAAYGYLVPAFFVMGLITFYPLLFQVWMSFTDYGIANLRFDAPAPNLIGLKNYIDIFTGVLAQKVQNFSFWRLLAFNLFWTFSNVPIHVALGILIAVLLNVKGLWFKKVYRAIYILPIVLPTLVIATVWRNMFDQDSGAINLAMASIGQVFGVAPEVFRIRWMESIEPPLAWLLPGQALPLSYYAMLITNIWLGWPFMTIVATGALQSIPGDLYEAAAIDGASPTQQFFNITLPLIRPAMVPAAMYGIIMTFNLFNLIYMMSGGGPLRKTQIMVTTAYDLVNGQRLYGMAAAFCVIIFFVLLGLTLLTNRFTKATERYDV
ncbi:MAG: sugar ABC transporter permease [Chloroflexi bacterium]|nr:sugar ABC transporter permease [Chloroflexota bacterium]